MSKSESRFRFARSQLLPDITVLQAAMRDFSYDRHAHEEYAFGVTLRGRQDFFSSGSYHRSPPGNVIVFNPDQVHDGEAGDGGTLDYVMVYVHPQRLAPLFASAVGHEAAGAFRISETLMQDTTLRHAILDLAWRVSTETGSRIEQEQALYRIATRLAQRAGRWEPDARENRSDALLGRAKDYIHAHVGDDLSLDDISRAANLSKYHFLRLFRRQFGITPHQYVLTCRVNAARAELESGADLGDVALRYGFADLSHFNRRFKRIYGMTPHQYRRHVSR